MADIQTLYLAGAFGSYLEFDSARRIGLLECPSQVVTIAGNTALRGAKQILAGKALPVGTDVRHVMLAANADFEDLFVSCMRFPAPEIADASSPSGDQARRAAAGGK